MTEPNPGGIRRRRHGLAPKRELRDLAADAQPLPAALDLVHITSVGAGREIVNLGRIEARPCVVFKRDLVYMFLARPAYRLRNGDAKSDPINHFPCAFVIRPDKRASAIEVAYSGHLLLLRGHARLVLSNSSKMIAGRI